MKYVICLIVLLAIGCTGIGSEWERWVSKDSIIEGAP